MCFSKIWKYRVFINYVFSLKICVVCVHTLTPRENRERPESGIFYNLLEKKQYLMNTLYDWSRVGELNIGFIWLFLQTTLLSSAGLELNEYKYEQIMQQRSYIFWLRTHLHILLTYIFCLFLQRRFFKEQFIQSDLKF